MTPQKMAGYERGTAERVDCGEVRVEDGNKAALRMVCKLCAWHFDLRKTLGNARVKK